MENITFTIGTTKYAVQPENAAKWRAAAEKANGPIRKRPITAGPRRFPKFKPGMTSGEYIAQYAELNRGKGIGPLIVDKTWSRWDCPAPMPNWSLPECVEEVNEAF